MLNILAHPKLTVRPLQQIKPELFKNMNPELTLLYLNFKHRAVKKASVHVDAACECITRLVVCVVIIIITTLP